MKKVFAILLGLMMFFICATSAMAQVSDATLTFLEENEIIFSICHLEKALYLLGEKGLYVWHPGQSEAQLLLDMSTSAPYQYLTLPPENHEEKAAWQQAIRYLFSDGTELYALQPYSGQIFAWKDNQLVESSVLPKEQLFFTVDDQEQPREIKSVTFFEGSLYLVLGTDDYEQSEKTELFSWDISQDVMLALSPIDVQTVVPGSTGKLLLYISPSSEVKREGAISGLWQYDIASGELEKEIMPFDSSDPSGGYAWNEQEQCLYFSKNGEVIALQSDGKMETKAYLPVSYLGPTDPALISMDGWYAYRQFNCVLIRDITGENAKKQIVVRIMGDLDQNAIMRFTASHPDVAIVTLSTNKLNGQSVQQSMVSGDQSIDLYVVNSAGAYSDIKKKGYAASMNQNNVLLDQAKLLYPPIQEVIFQGDQLLAYPSSIQLDTWTVNKTVWDRIGLGEYPNTLSELLELSDVWNNEYAQEYAKYTLIDLPQGLYSYISLMVSNYIMQHETSDTALSFDDPVFRNIAEMVMKYKSKLSIVGADMNQAIIMTYNQGFGVGSNDGEKTLMLTPPALDQGQSRFVTGKLDLFVLNPLSINQESALEFISFYLNSVAVDTKYELYPSLNEPVRYNDYETRHAKIVQEITLLEEILNNALPESKKNAQSALEDKQIELTDKEMNEWLISQESIDNYRSVAQHMIIPMESLFLNGGEAGGYATLKQVITRFSAGELTVDQFIKDLDKKVKMIYQEGE